MKTVQIKRMFRAGSLSFMRNGMVSFASVLVMTITLSVLSGIMLFDHVLKTTLSGVEDRVDVTAYFLPGTGEDIILDIQEKMSTLAEVAEVSYVSEREALEAFRARHENDQTTLQALDELDENPIGAMLNIRAKEISQYESIANFFEDGTTLGVGTPSVIDQVDYNRNKEEIQTIQDILRRGRLLGILITVVLAALSIIVTFNTIRLAIFFAREEIGVMRLVGASRLHIRGPFIVEGALYGIVATVFTILLFLPITGWFGSKMTNFFGGINLFTYYTSNILWFILILLFSGVILGSLASLFATRRYLTK